MSRNHSPPTANVSNPKIPIINAMPLPIATAFLVALIYGMRVASRARRIHPPSMGNAGMGVEDAEHYVVKCDCAQHYEGTILKCTHGGFTESKKP